MVLLKLVDRRPAGFLTLVDDDTGMALMESGLRQCVHCQFTWQHQPGSGILRGFCFRCNGHTCGKVACMDCYPAEKRVEDIEAIAWGNKKAIEAAVRQAQLRERLFPIPRPR